MMSDITAWVKGIVLILIFATFVELLLPNGSMLRFLKVIIGLFIILAILNPVAHFLSRSWDGGEAAIAALTPQGGETADEVRLPGTQRRLAAAVYKQELAQQIRVLVTNTAGVADARVAVTVDEQGGPPYGRITGIAIFVKPGVRENYGQVQRVTIATRAEGAVRNKLDEVTVGKIRRSISEFYHLSPDIITIEQWSK